jgi:hypothetical protein
VWEETQVWRLHPWPLQHLSFLQVTWMKDALIDRTQLAMQCQASRSNCDLSTAMKSVTSRYTINSEWSSAVFSVYEEKNSAVYCSTCFGVTEQSIFLDWEGLHYCDWGLIIISKPPNKNWRKP